MNLKRTITASVAVLVGLAALFAADSHALVNVSVACVRGEAGHSRELVTQQLMGFPVKILSSSGGWSLIETADGYRGYVIDNSLSKIGEEEYDRWRSSRRVIYTEPVEGHVTAADGTVSDIVAGCIVEAVDTVGDRVGVRLPDGRVGMLPMSSVMPLEKWASQPFDAGVILDYARANIGVPYLWGGTSSKSTDCSGLTWVAYFLNGRMLMRDAGRQAVMEGRRIDSVDDLEAGDLIFFGNPATRRVNHVAVVENGPRYIESSGRVRRNSLDPADSDHRPADFFFGLDLSRLAPIGETATSAWFFK